MRDTDWRPSPCPECGTIREAAEDPICLKEVCVVYGLKHSDVQEGYRLKEIKQKTKTFQKVECYRDSEGGLHETKEGVVRKELALLLGTAIGATSQAVFILTTDAKIRRAVMDLLKELG